MVLKVVPKYIFGAADEVELEVHEQVISVKWSLHAREEIVFELLRHLRGSAARCLLEEFMKSSRAMIEEQEAVRDRLFTIQGVMQSTVRTWLQICIDHRINLEISIDKSLTVIHNLGVFAGGCLVLSIITGPSGINADGILGAEESPHAFALLTSILVLLGAPLIGIRLLYLGSKKPIVEEDVLVRKLELTGTC